MKFTLRIVLLLLLVTGTLAQDFNLLDALDDPEPTPKPTEKPKAGEAPAIKPKKPSFGDSGGDGFDLGDALHPDPATEKPAVKPPKSGGGGGSFGDFDLLDVSEGGDYKPDGGHSGGHAVDPGADHQGGADQPQDPDHVWGQILKKVYANMPEEVYYWMSNLRRVLTPLLERVENLLQALP
ncbi:CD99 molecule isoform X2 [Nothobranchius furzeri]|uniref:CD99 molecule isoform X2 n=1 Tax=Nothobranchius furzeri TaxID=105023 RepID=UPI00077D4F33